MNNYREFFDIIRFYFYSINKDVIHLKKGPFIIFIIIILLIGGSFIVWMNFAPSKEKDPSQEEKPNKNPNPPEKYTKEQKEKLALLDNVQDEIDFFHLEYLDRYISYAEKNSNLSKKQVVIEVNIGLDQDYYTNTRETTYLNKNYLLSNKYISMPSTYVPDNLEKIPLTCAISGMQLVKEANEALIELAADAKAEGYAIRAMSTYRSYSYQVTLYNNYVDRDGKQAADTYSARPGFSEHQTGLVADVDNGGSVAYTKFHTTKEYTWMQNNAHKYGFIMRYPKGKENITGYTYESWHYRYVGVEAATYIHNNNITFDEYYVQFIEGKK